MVDHVPGAHHGTKAGLLRAIHSVTRFVSSQPVTPVETGRKPHHRLQAIRLTPMKIPLVHNPYQTPAGEHQVFAQETDLLRCHGHHVLSCRSFPASQTIIEGAGE